MAPLISQLGSRMKKRGSERRKLLVAGEDVVRGHPHETIKNKDTE